MPLTNTEKKLKSRIYQRRYRDTKKGSVLLKSHYNKQNKTMKNLFEKEGINTNKNFNKPLKPIQRRRLANFIRRFNKALNSKGSTNKDMKDLLEKREKLLQDYRVHLLMLLKTQPKSDKADELYDKLEEMSREIVEIEQQMEAKGY
jgi:hypothetical protein